MPPVETLGVEKMKSELVFEVCIRLLGAWNRGGRGKCIGQIQSGDQSQESKNCTVCNCIAEDKLG